MMRKVILYLLVFLFSNIFLIAANNFEIDTAKVYKIETVDGSNFYGKIREIDSLNIEITLSTNDKLNFNKNNIIQITEIPLESIVNGSYRFPNPNPHIYFLTSSALKMKKGDAYYQNTYVFLNSFRVAITDNFNIGAGLELLTLFAGEGAIFWLSPKYDYEISNNFSASTSILFLKLPTSKNSLFGIWSVGGTIGNIDHNLSVGMGYGFVNSDLSTNPAFSISGMTRMSKKVMFISENWFVYDREFLYILFYGFRLIGETMAFDIGFAFNHETTGVLPLGIPYINFIFKL